MPADKSKIGTGRRRESARTDPDRPDDSRRARERAIDEEADLEPDRKHDRGWQPGADAPRGPHRRAQPGTRRTIEEADVTRKRTEEEE